MLYVCVQRTYLGATKDLCPWLRCLEGAPKRVHKLLPMRRTRGAFPGYIDLNAEITYTHEGLIKYIYCI